MITTLELVGPVCLAAAMVHGLFADSVHHWLLVRLRGGRPPKFLFALIERFFGELEWVFALWAVLFLGFQAAFGPGLAWTQHYLQTISLKEPLFVALVLLLASTRLVLGWARLAIVGFAQRLPFPFTLSFYFSCLTLGPLLGSWVSEPAAMTVSALLLREQMVLDRERLPAWIKYHLLALLFVNVSIGGGLTPYAAPAILMVTEAWKWGFSEVFYGIGWKGLAGVLINGLWGLFLLWRAGLGGERDAAAVKQESLLRDGASSPVDFSRAGAVAAFLWGLEVLGGVQSFWVEPLIRSFSQLQLFFGSVLLTSVIDNAALTYLGAQVPDLSEGMKLALVSGALCGGGLTVIANAPNPIGHALLQDQFEDSVISPGLLFRAATIPTGIAMLFFFIYF
jgi:hypothetical protein